MSFDKTRALKLAAQAFAHLQNTDPAMLEWARTIGPLTFRNLKSKGFLAQYCWVVYASGFKFATIEAKFPSLQRAFKNFDLLALSRMRSIDPVLKCFNNERKARSFLAGAKAIADEGFIAFKRRLSQEGAVALEELPGVGPITKDHLAKNIGLADVAKADRWLERAAALCGANSVAEFAAYIAEQLGETVNAVDVAIWAYAKDGLLPQA